MRGALLFGPASSPLLRVLLLATAAWGGCGWSAQAGAPTLLPGSVQIMATGTFVSARNDRAPGRRAWKDEVDLVAAWGVADGVTILFSPRVSAWAERGFRPEAPGSPWRLDAGASVLAGTRVRLLQSARDVVSVEAGVRSGVLAANVADPALRRALEAEVRLLWLRNFRAMGLAWFLDAQGGYRHRLVRTPRGQPSENGGEIVADVTLGVHLTPRLMFLAQNFSIFPVAGPAGSSHKLQASLAWRLSPAWTVQAGFVTGYAGRAWRERGVVVGLWRSFEPG